jgi:hypothetical protein
MWQGLTTKNPNRATSASLARIMVVPWVAFAVVSLLLSLVSLNRDVDLGPKFFLSLWVGLSLAADIGFGSWSRHKWLTEFRVAAAHRYVPGQGFWKRLLGGGQVTEAGLPPVIRNPAASKRGNEQSPALHV